MRQTVKTALDGSQQHSQRHLQTLIELLGGWSNLISEAAEQGLAPATLVLALAPLHERVMETAMECCAKFKEDKHINSWHGKVGRTLTVHTPHALTRLAVGRYTKSTTPRSH